MSSISFQEHFLEHSSKYIANSEDHTQEGNTEKNVSENEELANSGEGSEDLSSNSTGKQLRNSSQNIANSEDPIQSENTETFDFEDPIESKNTETFDFEDPIQSENNEMDVSEQEDLANEACLEKQ